MTRAEAEQKLRRLEREYSRSGPIHRKDVWRQIIRIRRELNQYDRFQAAAAR